MSNCNQTESTSSIKVPKKEKDVFPVRQDLSLLKTTAFVPTLESMLPKEKNVFYSSTFLLAWSGLIKILKYEHISKTNYPDDFNKINESKSFINSLNKDDFETKVELIKSEIHVKTHFKFNLPFEYPLEEINNRLKFKNKPVEAFGLTGHDLMFNDIVSLIYYKNDENCILKLLPKDKNHEIILAKGLNSKGNLLEYVNEIQDRNSLRASEKKNDPSNLSFHGEDELIIPKLKFNLETNYNQIEGQNFMCAYGIFRVVKAQQSIALILDHKGAIIESEAEAAAAAAADTQVFKKKIIYFDQPFFILMKKKDQPFPYFAGWINDTSCMTIKKEKEINSK